MRHCCMTGKSSVVSVVPKTGNGIRRCAFLLPRLLALRSSDLSQFSLPAPNGRARIISCNATFHRSLSLVLLHLTGNTVFPLGWVTYSINAVITYARISCGPRPFPPPGLRNMASLISLKMTHLHQNICEDPPNWVYHCITTALQLSHCMRIGPSSHSNGKPEIVSLTTETTAR